MKPRDHTERASAESISKSICTFNSSSNRTSFRPLIFGYTYRITFKVLNYCSTRVSHPLPRRGSFIEAIRQSLAWHNNVQIKQKHLLELGYKIKQNIKKVKTPIKNLIATFATAV